MIKRIKIRDFKSIGELDLELDPVTVLVGRSGSGKSNIVQAIRFLRNLLLNYDEAINNEGGWERIIPTDEKQNPQTSIDVKFLVPGEERDYHYTIRFGTFLSPGNANSPLHPMEESLALGNEIIYHRTAIPPCHWVWLKPPPIPAPAVSIDSALILGRFPSLQEAVFANTALTTGIGFYHFPSSTLSAHHQPAGPRESAWAKIPGLVENAANYKELMLAIKRDYYHPDIPGRMLASLQAFDPSIQSLELDSLTAPRSAIVRHKANDHFFSLNLEQESDGLRRFYAHLLALYQLPAKLVLAFEEPENAISPGALSLLAEEFMACPRENRGQVILTTHSPGLLDTFDVESVRVVEMREGKTVAGRVSEKQRDNVKDHLISTGELLTVDKARIDEPTEAPQLA